VSTTAQRRTGRAADEEFVQLAEPFRRELLAHCYRMLGSVNDAEDLVQETYLSAWRAYHAFEGRSSLRTWLYQIATRACLKALRRDGRRPLPSGLGAPSRDPEAPVGQEREVTWLQPIPDTLFSTGPADPAVIVDARHGMRLALIAALQHLPARQRAVLILRDVLGWRAAEVAELLDTSSAAVNSALQRARAQLAEVAPRPDDITEPTEPARRALLDGYAEAFAHADIAALTRLLTQEASWEMPPIPTWFTGRDTITRFLAPRLAGGGYRMAPTRANGQPAFAVYLPAVDGVHRAHAIQVLTVTDRGITRVVSFHNPALFPMFALPPTLPAADY
jgi:RNA polymerase sigma-70 factor (ECF subfamily)